MLQEKKTNQKILIIVVALLTIVFMILFINLFTVSKAHYLNQFDETNVIELQDGWYLNNQTSVSFPFKATISHGQTFSISKKIDFPRTLQNPTLFFNPYYCDCDVLIDGKVAYSYRTSKLYNSKTDGCVMVLAELNNYDLKDQLITIKFYPQFDSLLVYHNAVIPLVGSKADVLAKLYKDGKFQRILDYLLFILAFLFLFFFWGEKKFIKTKKSYFLSLSLLMLVSAIYVWAQSIWTVVITPYPYVCYSLELLSSNLILLFVIEVLQEGVKNKIVKWVYPFVRILFLVCFTVQILLMNFTAIDYREMFVFTMPVLGIAWVSCLLMIIEIILQKDRKALMKILPIVIMIPIVIISFFVSSGYQAALIFEIALLVFVVIKIRFLALYYYEKLKTANRVGFIREYDDIDVLTGLENKMSFDKRLKNLWADKGKYSSIWCLNVSIFDYHKAVLKNGKKGISEILKAITVIIKSSVLDSVGIFKIGSDNFLVLLTDYRIDEIIEVIDTINNLQVSLPVELVIGYSCYNPESDDDLTNMLNFAEEMTEDKQAK